MNEKILKKYKEDIDAQLKNIYPISIRCSNNKRRKMNLPFRRGYKINGKFKNQKFIKKKNTKKICYDILPKIDKAIEEYSKNITLEFVELKNVNIGDKVYYE